MPRFSLVLPSTDRPALLPAAVEAALASSWQDFELVVSDNFSELPAREVLQSVGDARLRVLRTESRLSVSDHWEFFWPHLSGDFVMILGDDNALHPEALAIASRAIDAHDLELLVWRAATYFHPDWDIDYPPLPGHGNILGFEPGTTDRWYRCDPMAVVRQFARELRLSPCFPCMLTCIFSRRHAERLRRRLGRLFWPPNPDICISLFLMATLRGRPRDLRLPLPPFAFYDGFLAVGGRSADSNLASWLSRGRRSRRIFQYVAEFGAQDPMPHHTPKFVTLSNTLAAAVTLARARLEAEFADCSYEPKTLAQRCIEDMYVTATVPWHADPAFLAEVEQFLESLPPDAKAEVLAYRDACRRQFLDREAGASAAPAAPPAQAANGATRSWETGGTRYIDMAAYGSRDIAGAASHLAAALSKYNRRATSVVDSHRALGVLGEELSIGARAAAPHGPRAWPG
jgi:glycosyltransferase involved in cell wall biosynthesis